LSTDFLVENSNYKHIRQKLSAVKHLQFDLLNDRLFESMGDEKSGEPQWCNGFEIILGRVLIH